MAITTPNGSTPPNKRSGGAVFYNANSVNFVRAAVIPLQPSTFTQAINKQTYTYVANAWSILPDDDKAQWSPGIATASGYAYYQFINLPTALWSFELWGNPPVLYESYGDPFYPEAVTTDDGRFLVQFQATDIPTWEPDGLYFEISLQVSSLVPSIGSGRSNTPPIGLKQTSGYVFIGTVGPFFELTKIQLDWTDLILGLYGQLPRPHTPNGDPNQFTGSIFDVQLMVRGDSLQPYYQHVTNPTPPTLPTITWPYSFQAYVTSAFTGAARAGALAAPGAPTARWHPPVRLLHVLNRARRSRGLPALTRPNLARGFPGVDGGAIVLPSKPPCTPRSPKGGGGEGPAKKST